MTTDYMRQTQAFSTWGDKLLQHTDRLYDIQHKRLFRPITLQLAPTELCESNCPFCSVSNRPSGVIPWAQLERGIEAFVELGIKSIEITGGGNPLLYRDSGRTINNIIALCSSHKISIGVITNSECPSRHLSPESLSQIEWIRVSLAKLEEGKNPDDYDFSGVDESKLGFSYIVHSGTTSETLDEIKALASKHPLIKFVRIAADCLTNDSVRIKQRLIGFMQDADPKFFIKEINDNFEAFPGGCWVGMLRPYWTSTGVYICTSHVLKKRTYLPEYRICDAVNITEAWNSMNEAFAAGKSPYPIDVSQCWHCYYANTNQILSSVIHELPDKNFA